MTDSTDASQELTVVVDLGPRSYPIVIVSDRLGCCAHYAESWFRRRSPTGSIPGKALIVTDRNVVQPHATTVARSLRDAGWDCLLLELEPGERSKSLDVASTIYDRLVEMQADRQTVVVAVGGGVVGDTAGFAAATFARGIPFVQVPTTLLAQVDSSVGGKVAVNHEKGKNLIGAFYQPMGVLIETATLDTLSARDFRCGMAEVVKYGVILDDAFFQYVESNIEAIAARDPEVLRQIVARSCRLKADVVEQDEEERTGRRAVLNYGHTFAHAFEALSGYGRLLHGEAVAVGMIYASRLAERRKLIETSVTERQIALLRAFGLPTKLPESLKLSTEEVLARMRLDKKVASGTLRFVLPKRLGHVELVADVPEADVRAVLEA